MLSFRSFLDIKLYLLIVPHWIENRYIVTSLIAVARKIIIFDFSKYSGIELIGLSLAIFALAISYWIIRLVNTESE